MRRRLSFDWFHNVDCCGQQVDVDQHIEQYGTGKLPKLYEHTLERFYGTTDKDEMMRRSRLNHGKALVWCGRCHEVEVINKDTGECLENCQNRKGKEMDIAAVVNRVAKRISLTPEEKAMARDFEKAIKKYETNTKKWIKEETDKEEAKDMKKTYENDVSDLLSILEDFNTGEFERVYERGSRLDTAVRDEIPNKLWKYVAEKSDAS